MKISLDPEVAGSQIAFYEGLRKAGSNIPLLSVLDGIKGQRWESHVRKLRAQIGIPSRYDSIKRGLPSFMASASANGGRKTSDLTEHSGLLQLDIDNLGAGAVDVRDRIGKDSHVVAAWLSPGGQGVKGIMRIPAALEHHKACFAAADTYMRASYGVEIDRSCSNVNRLCFVSHDPELVWNAKSEVLPVSLAQNEVTGGAQGDNSPLSLNPESTSTSTSYITPDFFRQWPDLAPHYSRHVERYYGKPQIGQRNEAMVEIISSLFCVVRKDFALAFFAEYCRRHRDVFKDYPMEKILGEAESLLRACEASYPENLSEGGRATYLALPDDHLRAAFRICESLSRCQSDEGTPPPQFYLSCHELAVRLGAFDIQAQRKLNHLAAVGAIQKMENGTKREKGKAGVATKFCWQLGEAGR